MDTINRKGINYDVGTFISGRKTLTRDVFDPSIVKREMEIIKKDLHCTSVRISGHDIERLTAASKYALEQGLEVWFSPSFIDANQKEMLTYFAECAKAAEKLRIQFSNIIFVTGAELTFFMRGLVSGRTTSDRISTFTKPWRLLGSTILRGDFSKCLNVFLNGATTVIRRYFKGQLSYASGPWEAVNWSLFDIVGVDFYRDASNKKSYTQVLKTYFKHNKPVVITEFGCCTYKGAQDRGGTGVAIIDQSKTPNTIKEGFVRDETVQANYIIECLDILKKEKVDGAFVSTFVSPLYPYNKDPQYDLDMASFSIVKSYTDKKGETYKYMPWEPKKSFIALAKYYEY